MIHLAIDHGKKHSHAVAITDSGEICFDGKIPTTIDGIASIKEALPKDEPVHSTIEASWNWGKVYDALEDLGLNPMLSNPSKSRLVAESFTKTDRNDAMTHAIMLRAQITPTVHVPSKDVRDQKNILRHRFWLVRLRTMIKNRIHSILDRNHLQVPQATDLFGGHGRAWINGVKLREPDGKLLKTHLELLDFTRVQTRQTEKWVREALKGNTKIPILRSLPGVGPILGALIALEIDTIERFYSSGKFTAYCGLVPSTYSSGGKTVHGRLIPRANRHLRYAFIEAAWTAVRVSPYFSAFYRRLKERRGAGKAIGAVGRKLCEISYFCLKKGRLYEEREYRLKRGTETVRRDLVGSP
ncbi:IS110 family transposase [Elusimicrobiota bacterium]